MFSECGVRIVRLSVDPCAALLRAKIPHFRTRREKVDPRHPLDFLDRDKKSTFLNGNVQVLYRGCASRVSQRLERQKED